MKIPDYIVVAGLVALPVLFGSVTAAQAGERYSEKRYCREYTKSVRIGGAVQSAYGTACMQPDGSWEIVSYDGHEDLYDDIVQASRRSNGRIVRIENRPSTYWYPAYYRSRHPYYRSYSRAQPVSIFSFIWGDNNRTVHARNHKRHYTHGYWGRGRWDSRHDSYNRRRHDRHNDRHNKGKKNKGRH